VTAKGYSRLHNRHHKTQVGEEPSAASLLLRTLILL